MAEIRNRLWDLDGTLIHTQIPFDVLHDQASLDLALALKEEFEPVRKQLRDVWMHEMQTYYVNPHPIIRNTCKRLKEHYALPDEVVGKLKHTLHQVYKTPVYLFPDVLPALEVMKDKGERFGIATHALPTWSKDKIYTWNPELAAYLTENKIGIVPVNRPKDAYALLAVARFYGMEPAETGIVEDNTTVANEAIKAGFAECHLIHRSGINLSIITRQHEVHEKVIKIGNPLEIYQARVSEV